MNGWMDGWVNRTMDFDELFLNGFCKIINYKIYLIFISLKTFVKVECKVNF